MGDRYIITGTQIGMIVGFAKAKKFKEIEDLMEGITKKQFLGDREDLKKLFHLD